MARQYKLFLDGITYIDADGKRCDYKLTTSMDAKKAAELYQANATITDMHDRVVSKANIGHDGRAYSISFDREEMLK